MVDIPGFPETRRCLCEFTSSEIERSYRDCKLAGNGADKPSGGRVVS